VSRSVSPSSESLRIDSVTTGESPTHVVAQAPIPLTNVSAPMLDPLIGEQVGSYIITRKLGQGGMGAVYLGEHPTIGSKVAIKFLHAALSENASIVRRFYSEARAANLASHEHIVRVLDLGSVPGRGYYTVMEYVDGPTLAQTIAGKPQSLAFAGEILMQLCEALGQAHQRGVVHRDLKPDNVLVVERRGQPYIKVADFGIAKLREARSSLAGNVTQAGLVLGTPEYMSPEQCEGHDVDGRADIYALGVIAFELVTGRLPFEHKSFAQLLLAHMRQAPPSPRSLRPELPHAWEGLILRAMSKSPSERFPDVACFAAAVSEAGRAVVHATVTPAPQRTDSASMQLEIELVSGGPQWIMRAVQVNRAGAFICFGGQPPPLRSRVPVRFPTPSGNVTAVGEVVRHVSAAEAQAWNMEPGFALQFVSPSDALRAHLQAPSTGPAPVALRSVSESPPSPLGRYSAPASSHYEILGVGPEANRGQILARARVVQAELQTYRDRTLPLAEARKLEAACQRVQTAVSILAGPATRLAYDATLGNYRGIASALLAGLSRDLVDATHARFRAEHPAVDVQVGIHLARAKLARGRGNLEAAAQELEAGLTIDPLNLGLHDARARLAGLVP
jgi:serine/threonine protein kinase